MARSGPSVAAARLSGPSPSAERDLDFCCLEDGPYVARRSKRMGRFIASLEAYEATPEVADPVPGVHLELRSSGCRVQ